MGSRMECPICENDKMNSTSQKRGKCLKTVLMGKQSFCIDGKTVISAHNFILMNINCIYRKLYFLVLNTPKGLSIIWQHSTLNKIPIIFNTAT